MAVIYDSEKNIFTLHTTNTTYQMKVDSYGYLLHLYYGPRTMGNMEYLLVYMNRSFSGNPYVVGKDVTYSLDVLPQEYPTLGTGDYRAHALNIADAEGVECCNLTFRDYEISKGKYTLPGLPAVWAAEDEADTLKITLRDETGIVEVQLMYGVLEKEDVITRAVIIKNTGRGSVTLKKRQQRHWILSAVILMSSAFTENIIWNVCCNVSRWDMEHFPWEASENFQPSV